MNQSELNLAIVKSEGLVECDKWTPLIAGASLEKRCTHERCYPKGMLPNYCGDLNLMHELWNTLGWEEKNEFVEHLKGVFKDADCEYYNATALQRAEAYAKVKGIWKE